MNLISIHQWKQCNAILIMYFNLLFGFPTTFCWRYSADVQIIQISSNNRTFIRCPLCKGNGDSCNHSLPTVSHTNLAYYSSVFISKYYVLELIWLSWNEWKLNMFGKFQIFFRCLEFSFQWFIPVLSFLSVSWHRVLYSIFIKQRQRCEVGTSLTIQVNSPLLYI